MHSNIMTQGWRRLDAAGARGVDLDGINGERDPIRSAIRFINSGSLADVLGEVSGECGSWWKRRATHSEGVYAVTVPVTDERGVGRVAVAKCLVGDAGRQR